MKIIRIKNLFLIFLGLLMLLLNVSNVIAIETSTQVDITNIPKIEKAERDTKTGVTIITGTSDPGTKLIVKFDDATVVKTNTPSDGKFEIKLNDFKDDKLDIIATSENKLDSETVKININNKIYNDKDNNEELKKLIDNISNKNANNNKEINNKALNNNNKTVNNSKTLPNKSSENMATNKVSEVPAFKNNSGIIDTEGIFNSNKSSNNSEDNIRFPNKLYGKKSANESNNTNSNSSNEYKRLTGQPTSPSKARATVTENVSNTNKPYPIYHGGLNGNSKKVNNVNYAADARQFITFETKNGKTFHLVINHDEKSENVMLLTEISEDDLLNMVERKEPVKKEVKVEEQPKQVEKEPVKQEKKSELGTYLLIGLVAIVGAGGAYFFKKHKKEEADNLASFEENDIENNELEEIDDDIKDVDINEVIDIDKEVNNSNNLNLSNNNQDFENQNSSSEFDELDQNLENDEDIY